MDHGSRRRRRLAIGALGASPPSCGSGAGPRARHARAGARDDYAFNDSHFHLTNYIQEGTTSTTS